MEISPRSREQARHLLDFIDASPSPWHAVETIADYLRRAGFVALREDERWQLAAGGRYFVIRGGASIVAPHAAGILATGDAAAPRVGHEASHQCAFTSVAHTTQTAPLGSQVAPLVTTA
jgi:hypothetical protein